MKLNDDTKDDGLKNRMLEKKNCQNHLFSVQNASDLIFF